MVVTAGGYAILDDPAPSSPSMSSSVLISLYGSVFLFSVLSSSLSESSLSNCVGRTKGTICLDDVEEHE